jgi:predicted enzyme related to lactoylglutathione lyase
MAIKELGYIVLYARDIERSATFYGDVHGWTGPGLVALCRRHASAGT